MKKERFLIGLLVMALMLGLGAAAYAVPSLGVGTGDFNCTGATEYWDCFSGNLGGHGFALPASGVTDGITPFTNIGGANIWLLAEPGIDPVSFAAGGTTYLFDTVFSPGVAFGSYQTPYEGANLGEVDGDWSALPSPFNPATFYGLPGTLDYSGDAAGKWVFLVADDNGIGGLQGNGMPGKHDSFSPKTTGAVGVPEPSTLSMAVVGGIILIVGIIARRRAYGAA